MTADEVKAAVKEALKEQHHCLFNDEDRSLLKDMIKGAKAFKLGVIVALAGGMLYVLAQQILHGH